MREDLIVGSVEDGDEDGWNRRWDGLEDGMRVLANPTCCTPPGVLPMRQACDSLNVPQP
jgi:hypothetical protein